MYGQLTPDQYFHLAWQWYRRAPVYLVHDWRYRQDTNAV